ncbi:carbohydrate sulfotransferase 12-like [Neosynchiropus ocellatus]
MATRLRVAFAVGSLLMILMIIVYWDDVGGFALNPLQDPVVPGPGTNASSRHEGAQVGGLRPDGSRAVGRSGTPSAESREQRERKRRIRDVCSGEDYPDFPGRTRDVDQIPLRELDHLIVDDRHQIIYCYVPKVACTNWKRVMLVLSQSLVSSSSGEPYTDPETIPPDLVHNSSLYFTFAKFFSHYGALSRHMMALKLKHYTKFLFVRDPFVRLISAFRNKFERPNEFFYRHFGAAILRRYANLSGSVPDTAAEAFAVGLKPTFRQFVSYLLDPELDRTDLSNEHWQQVYRLCHPCQVHYDFIGQLENLESDAEQLLNLLQVDRLIRFPSGARNRTSASWVGDWFKQIPPAMRRDLYRLYRPDFQLFGYPEPAGLLQRDT